MFVKRIDTDTLVIGAPAKVNLFLQVLNRRPDGYHNINSIFQAVSLFDRLRIARTKEKKFDLQIDGNKSLSSGPDNLASKAWILMKDRYEFDGGLKIHLEKNIPIGAGLGGGSADGAAVILACNILYDIGLDRPELAARGAELGSDLPFFFSGGQAVVTGRGEKIAPITLPIDYWLLLVTPRFQVSTAQSYAALSLPLTVDTNPVSLKCYRTADELIESLQLAVNDFERYHLISYPEIKQIRDELLMGGACLTRMTGSGPTVFGIYKQAPDTLLEKLNDKGEWLINSVRPITLPLNGNL